MRDLMEKFGWKTPYIPMNVKNADKKLDALFADNVYIAELKRDGSRYTSIGGRFFSRKKSDNKKKPETLGLPVEKTENVPHLAEFFSEFPDMVVEGEIYYPGGKSNTVTGIMGCDGWKARMRQGFGEFDFSEMAGMGLWRENPGDEWVKVDSDTLDKFILPKRGPIKYMLFEMTYSKGEDLRNMPWWARRIALEDFYDAHIEGTKWEEFIHLSTVFEGENAKRKLLKWAEDNGEEGIVFKHSQSLYQCDKRPEHHWYRVKGKIFADVVVLGVLPPEIEHKGKVEELGKWKYWEAEDGHLYEFSGSAEAYKAASDADMAIRPVSRNHFHGWIGSVVYGLWKVNEDPESPAFGSRELVEAGSCYGMNDETLALFTEKWQEFVASQQVIEISAMERTEKGLFRHPQFSRFRDDKSSEDCLWEVEVVEGE